MFAFSSGQRSSDTLRSRICPGRYLAEPMVFVYVSAILHTLDVALPLDVHGQLVKEPIQVSTSAVS